MSTYAMRFIPYLLLAIIAATPMSLKTQKPDAASRIAWCNPPIGLKAWWIFLPEPSLPDRTMSSPANVEPTV